MSNLNSIPPGDEPEPEVWLPSAGLNEERTTRHRFDRFEPVALESLKYSNRPRTDRTATALIYVCEETGAERRWGLR